MLLIHRLYRSSRFSYHTKLNKYCTKAERKPRAQKKAEEFGGLFPHKFFNRKMKTPDHLYLANEETSQLINDAISPFLKEINCQTALEINPGAGYFTKKLLDREDKFRKIILIENLEHFMDNLNEIHYQYPERVKVKQGDLISLHKLSFRDRQDKGTRVSELLEDVPRLDMFNDDINMVMFGAVGSYNFFKHLINSIVFQKSLLSLGRCKMFLLVPPPVYVHLTCSNEIGYMIYRATSILFQIFFEYRFITEVPREHFLPMQVKFKPERHKKLLHLHSISPEKLFLVEITPRRDIQSFCSATDLPALWYFIKQNCVSRRNRIIPNLEKYIGGCGPRLIINKKKNIPAKLLFENEDLSKLPKYSIPCKTLSCQDFFPNINIYTQFGDLSASQMLTLFTQFRSWSEYDQSSFLASLENSLLKLETAEDESIDGLGGAEEDDVSSGSEETEIKQTSNKSKKTKEEQKIVS